MALIQCPDCGAQVSSNAPRCVHCGCVFTACPECGAVYAGKAETCRNCGYKIAPAFEVKNEYTKMDYAKSGYGENTTLAWKRKADVAAIVKRADSKVDVSEEEQETETFDNVSSAAYLSLVPNDRGRKIARLFLTVVVAVAVAFFVFKGFGENVDAFMASKGVPADLDSWFSASAGSFEESSFEFQYKTLIVAGAILATGKAVGALMDVSFSKRKNNWLSKIK